jgi:hypothetical protein
MLSSSTFDRVSALLHQLVESSYQPSSFPLSIHNQQLALLNHLIEQYPVGSRQWLMIQQALAESSADANLALAHYFHLNNQHSLQKKALDRAFELSPLKSFPALLAFYQTEYSTEKAWDFVQQQRGLIKHLSQTDQLIKLAIDQGEISAITSWIPRASQALLLQLAQFNLLDNQLKTPVPQCENSVQVIALTFRGLVHGLQLIQQFQHGPLAAYFCFQPIRYVPTQQFVCRTDNNKKVNRKLTAIRCDEKQLTTVDGLNTRFITLILPSGGANVHYGVMYLDYQDTIKVFEHEAMHWLGFVDEYPLPTSHDFCQQLKPSALNVVKLPFANKNNIALDELQLPWKSWITNTEHSQNKRYQATTGDEYQVGLYLSDTCQQSSLSSYKPLNYATNMQFYELPIPSFYLTLIEQDKNQHRSPSYDYNIALALLAHQEKEGWRWLERAKNKETDPHRKARIMSLSY